MKIMMCDFKKTPDGTLTPVRGTSNIVIAEADNVQFSVIKSWNKMRWDKKTKTLRGAADIELLDRLSGLVRLPPNIEQQRQSLHIIQDAVDRERVKKEPTPFYKYPVKMPLYSHQVRGANMCLITFGWVSPAGGTAYGN